MNPVKELHMPIYMFNKIPYSPVEVHSSAISVFLQHFKSLRSRHLRKAKPFTIVLYQALLHYLFASNFAFYF